MDKQRFHDLLEGYFSGELQGSQLEAFEEALEQHPDWRAELDQHRAIESLMRGASSPAPPPTLRATIMERVRAEREFPAPTHVEETARSRPSLMDHLRRFVLGWQAPALATVCLLAVVTYAVLNHPSPHSRVARGDSDQRSLSSDITSAPGKPPAPADTDRAGGRRYAEPAAGEERADHYLFRKAGVKEKSAPESSRAQLGKDKSAPEPSSVQAGTELRRTAADAPSLPSPVLRFPAETAAKKLDSKPGAGGAGGSQGVAGAAKEPDSKLLGEMAILRMRNEKAAAAKEGESPVSNTVSEEVHSRLAAVAPPAGDRPVVVAPPAPAAQAVPAPVTSPAVNAALVLATPATGQDEASRASTSGSYTVLAGPKSTNGQERQLAARGMTRLDLVQKPEGSPDGGAPSDDRLNLAISPGAAAPTEPPANESLAYGMTGIAPAAVTASRPASSFRGTVSMATQYEKHADSPQVLVVCLGPQTSPVGGSTLPADQYAWWSGGFRALGFFSNTNGSIPVVEQKPREAGALAGSEKKAESKDKEGSMKKAESEDKEGLGNKERSKALVLADAMNRPVAAPVVAPAAAPAAAPVVAPAAASAVALPAADAIRGMAAKTEAAKFKERPDTSRALEQMESYLRSRGVRVVRVPVDDVIADAKWDTANLGKIGAAPQSGTSPAGRKKLGSLLCTVPNREMPWVLEELRKMGIELKPVAPSPISEIRSGKPAQLAESGGKERPGGRGGTGPSAAPVALVPQASAAKKVTAPRVLEFRIDLYDLP